MEVVSSTQANESECDVEGKVRVKLSLLPPAPCSEVTRHVNRAASITNDSRADCSKQKKILTFFEVCIIGSGFLVILGLFSIPTVYFAKPSKQAQPITIPPPLNDFNTCIDPVPYSGRICTDLLASLQTCYSGTSSPLNLPSFIDQKQSEMQILSSLLLSRSQTCFEEMRLFLCLNTFTLCDANGTLRTATREGCLALRDCMCFEKAIAFLPPGILSECEDLPDAINECVGNISFAGNVSSIFLDQVLTCSDGFFYDENGTGLCLPECGQFERTGFSLVLFENFCFCVGFIFSAVMLTLALTFQRSSLFVFPAVIQVYLCGSALVFTAVSIPGIFANTRLFCSARDQIKAFSDGNETVYCKITATTLHYCLNQMGYWVMFHAIFIFWAMNFPFSYRQLKMSGKLRYVHITVVVLALFLPMPGALSTLFQGFIYSRNPSPACYGSGTHYVYFSFVLPLSVILGITACLLLLTFWIILKEFFVKGLAPGKKMISAGKAELKIMMALVYYTFMGVMGLASAINYFTNIQDDIQFMILCESTGSRDCNVDLSTYSRFKILNIVSLVMVSLVPVIAFVFNFDLKACTRVRNGTSSCYPAFI